MIEKLLRNGPIALAAFFLSGNPQAAEQGPSVDQDGTVHISSYALPLSPYMSEQAQRSYVELRKNWPAGVELSSDLVKTRSAVEAWLKPQLERARAVYPVSIETVTLGGVRSEIVTPTGTAAAQNDDRVLINLHGGGFLLGAGTLQLIESIPIAVTANIRVISVDYRQSPDHKFPAASEDVAAVYKELLKHYKPQNIGMYGQSTGGMLVAMSMAWFQSARLPPPGAIAMFSSPAIAIGGDFVYMATPLSPLFNSRLPAPQPSPFPSVMKLAYFAGADVDDPLISPGLHPEVLAQFPATLIVTGTRDPAASFLIHTHRQLARVGVDSQLELWEGMWHSFIQDVDLPESKEMYAVTAKFFSTRLGRARP